MVGLSPRPSRSVLGSSGAASENGLRGNPEGHGWPSARTPAARLRWHCAPARWAKDRTGRRSGDKIRGQLLPDPPRLRASLRALHRLLLPPERGKVAPKATEGGGHARQRLRPPPPPAKGWSPSPASRERMAPPDHTHALEFRVATRSPRSRERCHNNLSTSGSSPSAPSPARAGEGGAEGDGRGRPYAPALAAAPSTSPWLVPLPRFAGEETEGTGFSQPFPRPSPAKSRSRNGGATGRP